MALLTLERISAGIENTTILKNLDLSLEQGSIYAIMGPNGSGKSTLAQVIIGNPQYTVTEGTMLFDGKDIQSLEVHERAQRGIFLSFQYPREISGVKYIDFLKTAYTNIFQARNPSFKAPSRMEFRKILREKMKLLNFKPDFLQRYVNQGFSGGEKKKAEILQLALLEPRLAILDETDSGLDVDALKTVAESINVLKKNLPDMTIVVITHYQRILEYLIPDHVHVMVHGSIVASGDKTLATQLEDTGYESYMKIDTVKKGLRLAN